jgi:hypothetical protein
MAFDLEFASADGLSPRESHQMHVHCFAAWELERDSWIFVGADAASHTEHSAATAGEAGVRPLRAAEERGTILRHERDCSDNGDRK